MVVGRFFRGGPQPRALGGDWSRHEQLLDHPEGKPMSRLTTFSRPSLRRRLSAAALVLVVGLGVTACTFGDADGVKVAPRSTTPPPPSAGTADQNSPFIVAASAIGRRSGDQVATLHTLAASTTHDQGIPHDLVAAQAEQVQTALEGLIEEATMMTPPDGTPAAALVTVLGAYALLAGELSAWPAVDEAMPTEWFTQLEEADREWTQTLEVLSGLSGEDLLADLPTLVMPES